MASATVEQQARRRSASTDKTGDRVFRGLAFGASLVILVILGFVTIFLIAKALPTFSAAPSELANGVGFATYVWPLVVGTLISAVLSLLVATFVAIGVALFISHYAPWGLSKPVGYVIDLLAAIPSVIFGAWGLAVLAPAMVPIYAWLNAHLGFIPLFGPGYSNTGKTLLTASLVLGIMIVPIITAQSRELFLQTPMLHQEAALALGTTKWGMIRATVFPFARNGIVSAVMLGLGRALGETMAVTLVLSSGALTPNLIDNGNSTIPATIALFFPESFGIQQNELIAAGLVLFVLTFVVNLVARAVVSRYSEFSGAN